VGRVCAPKGLSSITGDRNILVKVHGSCDMPWLVTWPASAALGRVYCRRKFHRAVIPHCCSAQRPQSGPRAFRPEAGHQEANEIRLVRELQSLSVDIRSSRGLPERVVKVFNPLSLAFSGCRDTVHCSPVIKFHACMSSPVCQSTAATNPSWVNIQVKREAARGVIRRLLPEGRDSQDVHLPPKQTSEAAISLCLLGSRNYFEREMEMLLQACTSSHCTPP